MNDDELLELARELNHRREPYALVTVVRAVAPTSAYVGAQAIAYCSTCSSGWSRSLEMRTSFGSPLPMAACAASTTTPFAHPPPIHPCP